QQLRVRPGGAVPIQPCPLGHERRQLPSPFGLRPAQPLEGGPHVQRQRPAALAIGAGDQHAGPAQRRTVDELEGRTRIVLPAGTPLAQEIAGPLEIRLVLIEAGQAQTEGAGAGAERCRGRSSSVHRAGHRSPPPWTRGAPCAVLMRERYARGPTDGTGTSDRKSTRLNSSHVSISYAV